MPERINGGLAVVVLGALALIVSLSLDWFRPALSAWTVFEIVDLLLAALAVAALAIAVGQTIYPGGSLAGLSPRWLPAIGLAALAIVIESLINPPPAAVDHSTEIGAWIGLGAAAALTVGGFLATARVSLVITLRPRQEASEWGNPSPLADSADLEPDADDDEVYETDPSDEEYDDGYAEAEYVDDEDADAEEPEPTAEHSEIDDEAPPLNDERG
jgi:hypothetical protein